MKLIKHFSLFFLFSLIANVLIFSCTIWSAAGDSVKGNITLIAKNRDWAPDHKQDLKKVINKNSFSYYALVVEEGDDPGVKAGINEKGLTVIVASASCIPKQQRKEMTDKKNFLKTILTKYESVASVLDDEKIFSTSRPIFYMIADKDQIAYIEVAIDGKYSITKKENGILYHTNHYLNEKFSSSNIKVGKSSLTRFGRISELLSKDKSKFSMEDFLKFSNDKNDGPDNSIWRTGGKPKSERTLATWIVALPKNDPPTVYVKLANPNEEIKEYKFTIDKKFWEM